MCSSDLFFAKNMNKENGLDEEGRPLSSHFLQKYEYENKNKRKVSIAGIINYFPSSLSDQCGVGKLVTLPGNELHRPTDFFEDLKLLKPAALNKMCESWFKRVRIELLHRGMYRWVHCMAYLRLRNEHNKCTKIQACYRRYAARVSQCGRNSVCVCL